MEYRRLGRIGHMSSIVTLGTAAFGDRTQDEADRLIDQALAVGVNHFDVAPTYGDAELRLGDYLKRHPQPEVFIGCKTENRTKSGSRELLLRTMDRLGRDKLDLYQLHAVCNSADLDDCFREGGSMETLIDAREAGLVANLGITGHGWESPATHLAAIERYPFATTMTSANVFMVQNPDFAAAWSALTVRAQKDDIGMHVLKASARIAWGDRPHTFSTWYEPFTEQRDVDLAVSWALQQPITTICSAGDPALFGPIVDAASRYRNYNLVEQEQLLRREAYGNIFVDA
jgi:aryl-alcohol dehydrogenase-like predicted oxidoreductase